MSSPKLLGKKQGHLFCTTKISKSPSKIRLWLQSSRQGLEVLACKDPIGKPRWDGWAIAGRRQVLQTVTVAMEAIRVVIAVWLLRITSIAIDGMPLAVVAVLLAVLMVHRFFSSIQIAFDFWMRRRCAIRQMGNVVLRRTGSSFILHGFTHIVTIIRL